MAEKRELSAYQQKLLDPRWQKMRLKILERDEFACQACFDAEHTLHVHHRYYDRGKDPWDYPNEALLTLCEECHEEERDIRPVIEEELLLVLRQRFLAHELGSLVAAFRDMPMLHIPEVMARAAAMVLRDPDEMHRAVERYFEETKLRREAIAREFGLRGDSEP